MRLWASNRSIQSWIPGFLVKVHVLFGTFWTMLSYLSTNVLVDAKYIKHPKNAGKFQDIMLLQVVSFLNGKTILFGIDSLYVNVALLTSLNRAAVHM